MFGVGGAQTNVKAVITAEDRGSAVLKGFGQKVEGLGGAVAKGLKLAAVGIAAGTAAATAFGVLSVKAFSESQDVMAQTTAVLKSTGHAAGVTSDMVTGLAKQMQGLTKFSDEEVQTGENLLLTFTRIGRDIFPQATETMLNMSQALGQDVKSSAIQLGKALQDPILGVTALRRVGVNFSKDQVEVIKKLVESGNAAKAQKLILKELNTEFGNSARAAGQTFSGQLAILKNRLNDIQETIGQVIVTAITPFIARASAFITSIDWQATIDRTLSSLRNLWLNVLMPFTKQVYTTAVQIFNFLRPSLLALWNTVQTQVLPTLLRLWKEVIVPLAPIIGKVLVLAIWTAINALNVFLKTITPVINFILSHKGAVLVLASAFITLAIAMRFGAIANAFLANMARVRAGIALTRSSALSFSAFIKSPTMLGSFGILAAVGVGAFAAIANAARETMDTIDQTNASIDASTKSNEAALRKANQQYKSGKLSKAHFQAILRTAGGYASGGFTGRGGKDDIAGVVHRGEYVIPREQVNQSSGMPMTSSSPRENNQLNIVVNVGLYAGTEQEKRKVAMELLRSLQDVAGARGTTVGKMLGI
jgi:hypothetical protein